MSKKIYNQACKDGNWLAPEVFFEKHNQQKKKTILGKIYMIPLPLVKENLTHIPPIIYEIIPQLNTFFVENIRTARRYISSLQLGIDIRTLNFHILDQKTDVKTIKKHINILSKEKKVGLMSECGLPGIADPGAAFIERAQQYEIEIIPLTGPSSIFLALMGSGLNGQKFHFNGYLPIQSVSRCKEIIRYAGTSRRSKATQIFIETPYRNSGLLSDLLATLPNDILLSIAIELTGTEQKIITKSVKQWKKEEFDIPKLPAIFMFNFK